jgi:hypothetical protein
MKPGGPPRRCASCGRILAADSAEGLCAICLLRAGLNTISDDENDPKAPAESQSREANPVWEGTHRGDYEIGRLLGEAGWAMSTKRTTQPLNMGQSIDSCMTP